MKKKDIDFDKENIIKSNDEFDAYAATSHDDIPAKNPQIL